MLIDFKILERKYKGKEVGKYRIWIDFKKGFIIFEFCGKYFFFFIKLIGGL